MKGAPRPPEWLRTEENEGPPLRRLSRTASGPSRCARASRKKRRSSSREGGTPAERKTATLHDGTVMASFYETVTREPRSARRKPSSQIPAVGRACDGGTREPSASTDAFKSARTIASAGKNLEPHTRENCTVEKRRNGVGR